MFGKEYKDILKKKMSLLGFKNYFDLKLDKKYGEKYPEIYQEKSNDKKRHFSANTGGHGTPGGRRKRRKNILDDITKNK